MEAELRAEVAALKVFNHLCIGEAIVYRIQFCHFWRK